MPGRSARGIGCCSSELGFGVARKPSFLSSYLTAWARPATAKLYYSIWRDWSTSQTALRDLASTREQDLLDLPEVGFGVYADRVGRSVGDVQGEAVFE